MVIVRAIEVAYVKLLVQSRPLVRSAFCPTKIDLTSGSVIEVGNVGEVLLQANEGRLGAEKAF